MAAGQPVTLLIPAVLDAHMPLLKYAFYFEDYTPVVIEEREGIEETGLRYVHDRICYPGLLMAGQIIKALQSGDYKVEQTAVLGPQFLGGCLNGAFPSVLKRALEDAGFPEIEVLSLDGAKGSLPLPISTEMFLRAVAAFFYGDLLMLLRNQTAPYEKQEGLTEMLTAYWVQVLSQDLRWGALSETDMERRFLEIAADYARLELTGRKRQKVGITGELYVKYCRLGNRELEKSLQKMGCEYYINGITWYILYFMEGRSAFLKNDSFHQLYRHILRLQKKLVQSLREEGFCCLDAYDVFRNNAAEYMGIKNNAGDGWLMGAEFINLAKAGYRAIICGQPSGCPVSAVCGKGLYASLHRKLSEVQYVSLDYDAEQDRLSAEKRIQAFLAGCR